MQQRAPSVWRLLLESIYRLLGGDPEEIEHADDPQAVMMVAALYNSQGIPNDLTRDEQTELVFAVVGLSNEPLPVLSLGPEATLTLLQLIADLQWDLGL